MKIKIALIVLQLLILNSCSNIYELKKNGVKVTGFIMGGKSISQKQFFSKKLLETYQLDVVFYTKEGKKIRDTIKIVDAETYTNSYQEKEVEIVYARHNPSIFEIISGKQIKNFVKTAQRPLQIEDLVKMLTQKNISAQEVKKVLSEIEYGWKIEEEVKPQLSREKKDRESKEVQRDVADGNETDLLVLKNTDQYAELYVMPDEILGYLTANYDLCKSIDDKDQFARKDITRSMARNLPTILKKFEHYYEWKDFYIFRKANYIDDTEQDINFWFFIMKKEDI